MSYVSRCQVAEEAPRPDPDARVVLAGKDISSVCILCEIVRFGRNMLSKNR